MTTPHPAGARDALARFPALYFPWLLLCLVFPLEIYNRNASEFGAPIQTLKPFLIAGGLLAVASLLVSALLVRVPTIGKGVAAFSLWMGAAMISSELIAPFELSKAVGFDGTEQVVPPGPATQVACAVVLLALGGACWRWRNQPALTCYVPLAASVLLLAPAAWNFQSKIRLFHNDPRSAWHSIPPASPQQQPHPNVYHIILDGFRGSMFLEALREAGLSESDFEGFTWFPKNRSNFDGTQTSTPGFLTGTLYRYGSFRAWHNSWNDTGVFPDIKRQLGTDIQAYSFGAYHQLGNWVRGRRIEQSGQVPKKRAILARLTSARAIPPFFRAPVFARHTGVFPELIAPRVHDPRLDPFDLMLKDEALRPTRNEYVFSHLYFPHAPFLVDAQGAASPHAGLLSQSAYALRRVHEFLKFLHESGRYRDALIVIHSDHGWGDQVPAAPGETVPETIQIESWPRSQLEFDHWTSALLLVKPPGSESSPLARSTRSTQLLDLPNTLYHLLGLPPLAPQGVSVFAADYPDDPERHIFTGFRRWDSQRNRQLWFGQDFTTGEMNHVIWTQARGIEVQPPYPVSWEFDSRLIPQSEPTPLGIRRIDKQTTELSWPAALTQGRLEIQMARSEGEFVTIGSAAAESRIYRVGDLAADASYRFRARWSDDSHRMEWSVVQELGPWDSRHAR